MKAIILAAGRGSRLNPIDLVVPKPMVRVGGIPVLEHTIEHMDSLGIRDITITVGHLAKIIMGHFGDGSHFGVRIRYSIENPENLLGTAGGVKKAAADWVDKEPFVVWHGDNYSNCRLDRLMKSHEQCRSDITLVTRWRSDLTHSGKLEWDGNNRVTEFEEKPAQYSGGGWINSGIYAISPEMVDYLPDVGDFGRDVFPKMVKDRDRLFVHGLSHDEFFRWYDTPEDLAELRKDYAR